MAFALVGSRGAASQGASGAAVTPAWGAGESRTAGNLLICTVAVTGTATAAATPSGWQAFKIPGTSCGIALFHKIAAGGDAAPTIAAITSGVIAAQLSEYSGSDPAPQNDFGNSVGTSSPRTATLTGGTGDTSPGDLIIMLGADFRSAARTPSDTWTSNNGTPVLAGSNNGVSSAHHYSFGAIVNATGIEPTNSTVIMTCSTTTSVTGLAVGGMTFKQFTGPSLQTVDLGLISVTAAVYAPTVIPDQFLTVPQVVSASALYAPTLAVGPVAVSLGLVDSPSAVYAPTVVAGYAATVLADSPVAYWRAGEPSGSVLDSIGSAHGTVSGTVTRDVTGLIAAASDDGAIQPAASGYVSGALAAPVGNVFTVEAWLKVPAFGPTSFITFFSTKGTLSNISIGLARATSPAGFIYRIKGYIYDGAVYDVVAESGDNALVAGQTYHVVWTRAGTSPSSLNKIYVNGVDQGVVASSSQVVVNTDTTFYIGGWEGTAETWNDKIDEVALYNTALSAARVLAHYNAGAAAAGPQTITLPLIDAGPALYAPSLAVGPVGVSIGLITSTSAVYAPTLAVGAVTVSLGLVSVTAAVYAPAITVGAVGVSLDLVDSGNALYPPTLTQLLGAPVWTTPADGVGIGAQPALTFLIPTGGGPLHFQMELDDNAGFSSADVIDSSTSQTGWEYWNGSGWAAVPVGGVSSSFAGNEARHTPPSPLTSGTYYRRVRAGVVS